MSKIETTNMDALEESLLQSLEGQITDIATHTEAVSEIRRRRLRGFRNAETLVVQGVVWSEPDTVMQLAHMLAKVVPNRAAAIEAMFAQAAVDDMLALVSSLEDVDLGELMGGGDE